MMIEQPQHPLVQITWYDAWFDFQIDDIDDIRDDYYVVTVGYLIRDTLDVVSLAQEVLPDEEGFRSVTHIPKSLIKNIMPLIDLEPDTPVQ